MTVERLAALQILRDAMKELEERNASLHDELDRLKGENEQMRIDRDAAMFVYDERDRECTELALANATLKATLDAVRALPGEWREHETRCICNESPREAGRANAFGRCADELQAKLGEG